MAEQRPAPRGVDVTVPNVARMYDYYLGGKDNYKADRVAAAEVIAAFPDVRLAVRENRAFLTRAVQFLAADAGIRQFVDIGTGLPTQNNVHEIAFGVAPDARVVYIDYDPVVVAHGQMILSSARSAAFIAGDIRRPDDILGNTELRSLINFDEPVAVLMVAVLNFVAGEDNPAGIVGRFGAAMAPGSYLVISHGASEERPATAQNVANVYQGATAQAVLRNRAEILPFFAGFELLEPGLVYAAQWHPAIRDLTRDLPAPGTAMTLAGVGRLD
ncbi:MAG TPA: SAM-dependent methyltransferase [Streptosporangiaceae bacterium]